MGSWVMAVFVTAFSWVLIFFLESQIACRIRIRHSQEGDAEATLHTVQSFLASRGCQLHSSLVYKGKRQVEFLLHVPAGLDPRQLELEARAKLPQGDDTRIDISRV
jgi:hypothetical protein